MSIKVQDQGKVMRLAAGLFQDKQFRLKRSFCFFRLPNQTVHCIQLSHKPFSLHIAPTYIYLARSLQHLLVDEMLTDVEEVRGINFNNNFSCHCFCDPYEF